MKAYVLAASMIPFGKYPDRSTTSLGRQAIEALLTGSGVAPGRVQAVYSGRSFGSAIDGQFTIPAQVALRGTGIEDIPVFNVENACAAGASALHLAAQAIRAEQYDLVLVVAMDKLFSRQRRTSMKALFGAMDVEEMAWIGRLLDEEGEVGSVFMENYYAPVARKYLADTGATPSDYARIAVKNRRHAAANPHAQYRAPLTEEEVMASAVVAEPLRALMCSPLTDGAVALLLGSKKACGETSAQPIEILASEASSGLPFRKSEDPVISRVVRRAYERSGIGPEDLDLLEVHDASAVAELIAIEEILLRPRGDGLRLSREGATGLGGSIPVNVSGGLLSRGHPGAATGGSQIVELVWQLQRAAGGRQVERARIGLAQSSGGSVGAEAAATVVTILGRA